MDLNAMTEFDLPFRVLPDGSVEQAHVQAPELWPNAEGVREVLTADDQAQGWSLLSGYTAQYGYRGPVMHASEYLGGRLARDILATPGVYVLLVADVEPTDDDPEPEPAGWVIAYREDA